MPVHEPTPVTADNEDPIEVQYHPEVSEGDVLPGDHDRVDVGADCRGEADEVARPSYRTWSGSYDGTSSSVTPTGTGAPPAVVKRAASMRTRSSGSAGLAGRGPAGGADDAHDRDRAGVRAGDPRDAQGRVRAESDAASRGEGRAGDRDVGVSGGERSIGRRLADGVKPPDRGVPPELKLLDTPLVVDDAKFLSRPTPTHPR